MNDYESVGTLEETELRTNDGRVVAYWRVPKPPVHIDPSPLSPIVYKKVRESTHKLQIPEAWTYDDALITQVNDLIKIRERKYAAVIATLGNIKKADHLYGIAHPKFVIETTDTKKVYWITYDEFNNAAYPMKWRQDHAQVQWVVLMKHWHIKGEIEQGELL